MLLSLERTPLVISHLSCVFIGLFLSFYLQTDKGESECFLPGKIFVSLPNSYLKEGAQTPFVGEKIHISKHRESCLIKKASGIVVQGDPFVVMAFPFKQSDFFAEIFDKNNKKNLDLLRDKNLNGSVKFCEDRQIHYGYSH
jgi:hypothetical protein